MNKYYLFGIFYLHTDMLYSHLNIMKDILIGHPIILLIGIPWLLDQRETLLVSCDSEKLEARKSLCCSPVFTDAIEIV